MLPETNREHFMSKETHLDITQWAPYRMWKIARTAAGQLELIYGKECRLSNASWRAMAHIAFLAPVIAKDLGPRIGLDPVRMSRAIDQLFSHRLITRRVSKADRRKVELRLSKKGEEVYAQISPVALAIESDLMECLTSAEQLALKRILDKLEGRLERLG